MMIMTMIQRWEFEGNDENIDALTAIDAQPTFIYPFVKRIPKRELLRVLIAKLSMLNSFGEQMPLLKFCFISIHFVLQ